MCCARKSVRVGREGEKKMDVLFIILLVMLTASMFYLIACVSHTSIMKSKLTDTIEKDEKKACEISANRGVRQTRIVILGAARNAIEGLPFAVSTMRKIRTVFPNTRCVIIENDSSDGTREYIQQEMASAVPLTLVDGKVDQQGTTIGKSCARIARMASIRNQLMQHVTTEDEILVVYDVDWKTCVPIEPFVDAVDFLQQNDDINGVAPLLLKSVSACPFLTVFYDTFAFQNQETKDMNWGQRVWYLQKKCKWGTDPVAVDSAFGCLAIYKNPLTQNRSMPLYKAIPTQNEDCDCEHIPFNLEMKQMYLLPSFKILAAP